MVNIVKYILGPLENNTYLIEDAINKKAIVIDPSAPSRKLMDEINNNGILLEAILLTHAHFDHISGVNWLIKQVNSQPIIALHKNDFQLWRDGGGSREFGFSLDLGDLPNKILDEKEELTFGEIGLSVFHTPGHTPGHVTFYLPEKKAAFCGDLIFYHGVGRTDLSYGDEENLISSITNKIFTLPEETILYPGHGPETTVAEEIANNPFI
jgi:hydroxyacylglutathione hydrolase